MKPAKILLTGAAGRIGQTLLGPLRERYEVACLDIRPVPGAPEAVVGDLADPQTARRAMDGVDTVIHLAGNPYPDQAFEALAPPNIHGLYNVFQNAVEHGARRIVFASSCHTVLGYPDDKVIDAGDACRPDSYYGVTKVFGEALGRYFHDQHGLEFVALRVGMAAPPGHPKVIGCKVGRWLWISPGDLIDIFLRAIEAPDVGFLIAFATSIPETERVSLRTAKEVLGYEPRDRVIDQLPEAGGIG